MANTHSLRPWNWIAPWRSPNDMPAANPPSSSAATSGLGDCSARLEFRGRSWFSWATGPNAGRYYGAAKLATSQDQHATVPASPLEQPKEPVAFYAPSVLNTVDDVLALGSGPGTEALHGSMENTALFKIIRDNF